MKQRGKTGVGGVAQVGQGGGGGMHQVGGYNPLQSVHDVTALCAHEYAPTGGRPTKRGHELVVVEAEKHPPPHL